MTEKTMPGKKSAVMLLATFVFCWTSVVFAAAPVNKSWTDPATGMAFVWVPGGCYEMGCGAWQASCYDDEKPARQVCVDGFWLGTYEVTQAAWGKVMPDNPSFYKGEILPVTNVSWDDIQEFVRKLNARTSDATYFRLPTEAEWEYACRSGGKPEKFCGADSLDQVAWYLENSGNTMHPVGQKSPNGLGLYDMSGNAYEWCQDIYNDEAYYPEYPHDNPLILQGLDGEAHRVYRGGSFDYELRYLRSTDRRRTPPEASSYNLGFRLVRKDNKTTGND